MSNKSLARRRSSSTSMSLLYSVLVHFFAFLIMAGGLFFQSSQQNVSNLSLSKNEQEKPIIHAVAVNQDAVMSEMAKLEAEREHQQQTALERQRQLEQMAQSARAARVAEEKRTQHLKQEQELQLSRAKKQTKKLQELLQKQQSEQQQLSKLLQEKEKIAEQKADAAKKLDALRKAQLREQQKLDQKKLEQKKLEQKKLLTEKKFQTADKSSSGTQKKNDNQPKKKVDDESAYEKTKQLQQQAKERLQEQMASQQEESQQALNSLLEKYKVLITNAIGRQWILPGKVDKNAAAQFLIRLGPQGQVLSAELVKSSGDPALDHSAQVAIYKASPLPIPTSSQLFKLFHELRLTVRPESSHVQEG